MTVSHDVIVVGAGPGGSATAHFLAKQGLDVLLLDKAAFPRDKTCGDGLPPRAITMLAEMGILDAVLKFGWRLDVLDVSSPAGTSTEIPIPPLPDAPSYAVIAPRLQLDDLLRETAIRAGATFHAEAHIHNVQAQGDGVVVSVQHNKVLSEYRAKVVVIATGASTRLLINMHFFDEPPPTILAARAYFENIAALKNRFHFGFAGVTMPGYGWVFPLSETSANIGTGFIMQPDRGQKHPSLSPRTAFDSFTKNPVMEALLQGAEQVGPVKSYPLRANFATARTYSDRVLLVGEAAGLVNPLTGDGIDYALESGKVAADYIQRMFAEGDFSSRQFANYDAALRQKYQNLFLYCERIQKLCLNRPALNILIPMANHFPKLATLLVTTVLGGKDIPEKLSPLRLMRDIVRHL